MYFCEEKQTNQPTKPKQKKTKTKTKVKILHCLLSSYFELYFLAELK